MTDDTIELRTSSGNQYSDLPLGDGAIVHDGWPDGLGTNLLAVAQDDSGKCWLLRIQHCRPVLVDFVREMDSNARFVTLSEMLVNARCSGA